MKKIQFFNLIVGNQTPVAAEFLALKMTKKEALSITLENMGKDFTYLQKIYNGDLLKTGEYYKGYILFNNGVKNMIIYMDGYFVKETDPRCAGTLKEAFNNGTLYTIEHPAGCLGCFKRVFGFSATPFEDIKMPHEKAEVLREKLANGIISDQEFEITDEEFRFLRQYLGSETMKSYFVEK